MRRIVLLGLAAGLVAAFMVPAAVSAAPTIGSVQAEAGGRPSIEFWSTETQPERLEVTQAIIDDFTADHGVEVVLVSVDESELADRVADALAKGTLPDVIIHGIEYTSGWFADGILDATAAHATVRRLGVRSFSPGALALVSRNGRPMAVPSDGWGQLIIYRSDLFASAGLEAPTTFADIATAAAALHDPANGFFGITAASDGDAIFTQQTFEHFALANGCELVDEVGHVTLDSQNCVDAIAFYTQLLTDFSPGGIQTVASTRSTYLAGNAAMVSWSPFILDELAGLNDSAPPTCDECDADPSFLARNSGLAGLMSGPNGKPAQYGQLSSFGITTTANRGAAQAFVIHMLGDGYLDWLSLAPEGKVPMRTGTRQNATLFIDAWPDLEIGVDRKAPLSDFYSSSAIDAIVAGAAEFDRWGFAQDEAELVSAVYESLVVPDALRQVLDGTLDPQQAANELQETVEALRD